MKKFLSARPWIIPVLAGCIILAGVATSFFAFHTKSSTVDESVHETAGYSYWATRDFRLNPEHPPLVKEVAALPLLFMHLDSKANTPYFSQEHLWDIGPLFIFHNTVSAEAIQFAGKTSLLVFFVLLGVLVFRWSRELFGDATALVILTFTMFSPNLLAHSGLITTDLGMSFGTLFAAYTTTQWLKKDSRTNFVWMVVGLLTLFLVKFSALVIAPLFFVVLLAHSILHTKPQRTQKVWGMVQDFFHKKFWPFIFALLLMSVGILLFYNFNFHVPATSPDIRKYFDDMIQRMPAFVGTPLHVFVYNVPVPFFHFLEGAIMVLTHNGGGHTSFLLGEVRNVGWWYYFPVLFLLKSSLVELVLTLGVVTSLIFFLVRPFLSAKLPTWKSYSARMRAIPIDFLALVIIPTLFFYLSTRARLNLGLRHVLLVYPFIFILSGVFLRRLLAQRLGRVVVILGLVASLTTAWLIYPNYLAYFNVLGGGTNNARNIATDSNVDWGQDLKALSVYLREHHISRISLYYFGTSDPHYYGIEYDGLPSLEEIQKNPDIHGTFVISTTLLSSPSEVPGWFLQHKPTAILNGSLYIFTL